MTSNQQPSNMFYPVANALASSNPFVEVFQTRDPTVNDTNYPVQKRWFNKSTGGEFILTGYTSNGGVLQAVWAPFAGSTSIVSLGVDTSSGTGTNPVLRDALGKITINGAVVAAGSIPIETNSTTPNAFQIQLQKSQAIVSTDATKIGLAAFNSAQFSVDANGFVSALSTGSTEAFQVDSHTAPGTSPVVPNMSGVVIVQGAATSAGNIPVQTNSLEANTYTVQVQTSQAIGGTDNTKIGLAAFYNMQFGVDVNGFVTLAGGTGPAGQTITGNSGGALSPTLGNWNIDGTGSITTVGSGSTLTVELTGLTNHALLIGAGTTTITKLGAGTTGQVLQTNTGADPTWSTATYPSTVVANEFLYASSTNVVGQLATGNNGVLITSNTGVPSFLANGTTGQVLTATTGSPPSWSNVSGTSVTSVTGTANQVLASPTTGAVVVSLIGPYTPATYSAHGVLVGEGTSSIVAVSPSATSGVPLISQGSSSDPLFGTAAVAGGGTGTASLTAYAVITGGTTSTGAVQQVSGLGTSGQVLTSNGAGALPTWQDSGSGGGAGSGFYGDGSDGGFTFDGSTTILGIVPSSNIYTLARDTFLTSSTINSGVTIRTNGFRLFCQGTLTNNGTIQFNGNNGVTSNGGASIANGNSTININSDSAGSLGSKGGNTGNAGTSQGVSLSYSLGGAGGAGGAATGGPGVGGGASGGTVTVPGTALGAIRDAVSVINTRFQFSGSGNGGYIVVGGAGGGGGTAGGGNGGGGGSGGGIIVLSVKLFAGTGTISANGGTGAAGTTLAGGGGGGGGGVVFIISNSVASSAISGQTITANGGTGGAPASTGKTGAAGSNGTVVLVPN